MNPTREPSLEELRAESERTREALASTVRKLRERVGDSASELKALVSPTHIKQEITDYVSRERRSVVETVRRKAVENPLQAAAVGAAVAYPAWGLLRAIPAPLLLIGAGLFLTSQKGQQAAKTAKAKIDDVAKQSAEQVAAVTTSIRSDVEKRASEARLGGKEIADTLSTSASAFANQSRAALHDATEALKTGAETATAQLTDAAGSLFKAASNDPGAERDRAATASTTSRNSIVSSVNDNSLLLAGIGAAVGALLAASIPTSEAEDRLFGAESEKLKDKARNAAAKGIEKAGDIAADAAGSVATAAAREGLNAGGVQDALNTVANGVRAVADRGLDTALAAGPMQSQEPVTERTLP
jgi:hypothetical protein